ncbi:MAG: glycosyltransferase family 2 protein [Chordicoccus sp.]
MSDLVSVIIPIYKVERYLERCVRSVMDQTYDNLEILLIDDGSPDRCGKMCDAFAESDPRIRVVHRKNGGVSAARNTGIDASSGQWIFFVDSDDFIHRDCIRQLLAAAERSGTDIAVCGFERTDGDTICGDVRFPVTEVIPRDEAMRHVILEEDTSFVWGTLFRRELFQGIHFPEGRTFEDLATVPLLVNRCRALARVSAPYYGYFQRPTSIMHELNARSQYNVLLAWLDRCRFCHENYRELEKRCLAQMAHYYLLVCSYSYPGEPYIRMARDLVSPYLREMSSAAAGKEKLKLLIVRVFPGIYPARNALRRR